MELTSTSTTAETRPASHFQQALTATKAETSALAEQSLTSPTSPETALTSPPNESPAPTSEPPAAAPSPDDLISDAELAAIEAKHADDPKALVKELKGTFTKKTQALAAQRKADSDALAFARDFHANPTAAITKLAPTLGLTVTPTETERRATATTQAAQTVASAATEKLTALLGPELGAEFGSVIRSVAEETAKAIVSSQVEPILTKTAQAEHQAIWAGFEQKHPDWATHEKAMMTLGGKLQPNGMGEGEYLDLLYDIVTMPQKIAAATQEKIEKMTKGAQTAEVAARTVPETAIQVAPRKIRNFRDAYEETKAEQARAGAR